MLLLAANSFALSSDTASGNLTGSCGQLAVGRATESITSTSTETRDGSMRIPSCSDNAVKKAGPVSIESGEGLTATGPLAN